MIVILSFGFCGGVCLGDRFLTFTNITKRFLRASHIRCNGFYPVSEYQNHD